MKKNVRIKIFATVAVFLAAGLFFVCSNVGNKLETSRAKESAASKHFVSNFEKIDAEFPAGTLAGEVILTFENDSEFQNFLRNAEKNGWKILGKIDALKTVRVSTEGFLVAGKDSGVSSIDFNYRISVPGAEQISSIEKEAREAGKGGNVPVGKNALLMMGFNPEKITASNFGRGVLVAVLDSGISAAHPSLSGVPVSVIDIAKGVPDSPSSIAHGTAVASLILGNGADGVSGLAKNSELLSVRVFDGAGNGDTFSLSAGIIASVESGAQVINISAGVTADSNILRNAVSYAIERGVIIVAAAGNEGVVSLSYPAAYSGVISVGSVDGAGTSAPFSNIGENLSVVAPGVGVLAASTSGAENASGFSGTSASAPLVAGLVAAKISDVGMSLTPAEVSEALSNNSNDLGMPGVDYEYGYGIVDFERISRPAGTVVSDVRVSDFYVKKASGGNVNPSVVVGVQNRGTIWSSDAVLSLTLTFSDGNVRVSTSSVGSLPANASTGVELGVPAGTLAEGVLIGATLSDKTGAVLDQTAVKIKAGN